MKYAKRQKHKNIYINFSLISSFVLVPFIVIPLMYYNAINTIIHKKNIDETDTPLDLGGLSYEKVEFKSRKDNVTLKGIFFPAKTHSNKTLIVVHGLNQNKQLSGYTKKLAEYLTLKGYNILSFDLRCHGESDGNLITFGCCEKYDVMGAIDYLVMHKGEWQKIALLGFSMGAVTAIEAAGKDPRINAVIADSAFRDLKLFIINDLIASLSRDISFLPDKTVNLPLLHILCRFPFKERIIQILAGIYNINFDEASPMNTIKNIPAPVFLIHSKNDKFIPYANSESIYESLKNRPDSILWLTENAGHMESFDMYQDEYLKRVTNFLDTNLS